MTEYYSDITDDSWTESNKPHYHCTLAELFPNEIAFFNKRFVWPSNNAGCYVRYRYEKLLRPCEKPIPKWIPLKNKHGGWQHLYPALVNSLVEKHLHFEKFLKNSRISTSRDRLEPNADETAFWFGTMAGETTYNDCIDIDSHEQFGWNPLPTMWHSSRTGSVNGPYSWRFIPVVRPTLRFFQIAKVVYDKFPNRIWAFSSANFGLAVWKVYDQSEPTHVVYRKIECCLQSAGLTLEHYPMPAITGLGRCHRRPCGMDSAIITDDGLITDSIQQIRAFMIPPRTPSFETILEACFDGLRQSYDLFLTEGESIAHKRMPDDEKKFLVESCLETLEVVRQWAQDGYAIDLDLISEHKDASEGPSGNESDKIVEFRDAKLEDLPSTPVSDEYPAFFLAVDLKAVSKARQWVQFVKFLVDNGIPAEDRFSQVISALARWFGFVELFGEDRDRIKTVLRRFALTRHNNKVSRLIAGQEDDVLSHVDRIVDHALDHEDAEGKQLFAEIRQKRDNGEYKQVYFFEAEILGMKPDNLSPTSVPHSLSYLSCRGLIPESDETEHSPEWRYQPDDTPLPDEVMNRIVNAFKAVKRQIRRHGTTGRYSVLDSITRFYNYLFCGRKCGTRRASGELLIQMGFAKKTIERNQIISILLESGTLHQGGYRSGELSRQWFLDSEVIKAMRHSRIAARVVS